MHVHSGVCVFKDSKTCSEVLSPARGYMLSKRLPIATAAFTANVYRYTARVLCTYHTYKYIQDASCREIPFVVSAEEHGRSTSFSEALCDTNS